MKHNFMSGVYCITKDENGREDDNLIDYGAQQLEQNFKKAACVG
jgi:hypothetical protein